MSTNTNDFELSPDDRRRAVAAVLAKGLARWRKRARAAGFMPAPESSPVGESRLELAGETRLSVPDRTAG